ncbi:MAG: hypothetical protein AAF587_00800 [Bacteroidota bacterium]
MKFLLKRKTAHTYSLLGKTVKKRKGISIDRVLLGHSSNVILLMGSLMFCLCYEQSLYAWRMIEIVFPPADCGLSSDMPYTVSKTGYGEINIIGDKDGVYYYHTREAALIPDVAKEGCVEDLRTGLTERCLIRTDLKGLSYLIQYRLKELGERNLICTFGFMKRATFREIVSLLDLMREFRVARYLWRDLTEEELLAVQAKSFD